MNDLEQLLKRYGEDRRQQDALAGSLRHKARQQRRTVAIVGCLALISAIGLLVWEPMPPQAEVIVAESHGGTATTESKAKPAHQAPAPTIHVAKSNMETAVRQSAIASEVIAEPIAENCAEQLQITPVEDFAQVETYYTLSNIEDAPAMLYPLDLAEANLPMADQRLRFSAMLTANTTGAATQNWDVIGNNQLGIAEITDDASSTFPAKPLQMVSGNVGVDVTVASNSRSRLAIGVAVEGYLERMDVSVTQKRLYQIKGPGYPGSTGDSYAINVFTRNATETICGLNLALPFSWNFHPNGNAKAGWQIRLSPAYNILTSSYLSAQYGMYLNPWKLNVGLGLVLPKGAVKNVGFTANLLPMYQHGLLHEFGVSIGF